MKSYIDERANVACLQRHYVFSVYGEPNRVDSPLRSYVIASNYQDVSRRNQGNPLRTPIAYGNLVGNDLNRLAPVKVAIVESSIYLGLGRYV